MKPLVWTIATVIGLASPAFAYARVTEAYVTADVDLLAGPDQEYPLIDHLEEGSNVAVEGCTPGWEWCDVVAYGERGWVPGNALEVEYGDQWMLVPDYAPNYGIPVVVFSIRNYWDTYYRYRPFYYQRWEWYRRPVPHRPYPVDFPPPHPFHGPPPVHHHPIDYPPPYHHNPPPRVMPMPHPTPNPTPPPRVVPMPHPTPNPTPPPRVMPMPHPTPNAAPPPRVAPMPNPHVMPQKPAPASSKQNDQGNR